MALASFDSMVLADQKMKWEIGNKGLKAAFWYQLGDAKLLKSA